MCQPVSNGSSRFAERLRKCEEMENILKSKRLQFNLQGGKEAPQSPAEDANVPPLSGS